MAVIWEKCAFFQKEKEWLGFKISNSGVKPLVGKSDSKKKSPKPQKHIRIKVILRLNHSIYEVCSESVNSKFSLTTSFSKKKSIYQWNGDHTKAFEELKKQIVNIAENNHFDIKRMSKLKTDASRSGLGAT